jgi:hypothetical protein
MVMLRFCFVAIRGDGVDSLAYYINFIEGMYPLVSICLLSLPPSSFNTLCYYEILL